MLTDACVEPDAKGKLTVSRKNCKIYLFVKVSWAVSLTQTGNGKQTGNGS